MRFGFVMEQQAGMKTQYLNWRRVVERQPEIEATWVPITYYQEGGWIEKMRFVPGSARAVWRSRRQVEQGLGKNPYEALLFNTYNPAIGQTDRMRSCRSFLMFDVTPRQYDAMSAWYEHTPDRAGWLADWKHRRVTETLQAAEGLFAWSQWAAQSAIADYGADPERVHIVPPGVDTALWHPGEPAAKMGDGITRILFTGYAFERKGGDLLLRWARETKRTGWELHLVTLEPREAPPNVIVHTGLNSNSRGLIELAQKCDIFALPTRADCFSLASLEAMAAGLPVITSCVGGIPDIVQDGETGFLLAPEDYEGLRDRLETLLESPELRCEMGRRGRARVCASFNGDDCVQRGLNIMAGESG